MEQATSRDGQRSNTRLVQVSPTLSCQAHQFIGVISQFADYIPEPEPELEQHLPVLRPRLVTERIMYYGQMCRSVVKWTVTHTTQKILLLFLIENIIAYCCKGNNLFYWITDDSTVVKIPIVYICKDVGSRIRKNHGPGGNATVHVRRVLRIGTDWESSLTVLGVYRLVQDNRKQFQVHAHRPNLLFIIVTFTRLHKMPVDGLSPNLE